MSYIGQYTKEFLEAVYNELEKEDNKKKITEKVISPLTKIVTEQIKIYFASFFMLQIIILILLCFVIFKIKK